MKQFFCPIHKLFFTCSSNCCERSAPSEPLSDLSQFDDTYEVLEHMYQRGISMHASTITIGNRFYGSMSAEQQYRSMKKAIKAHISIYTGNEDLYIYEFELTKNGQLHAHGVEVGTYRANFVESFKKFGSRNSHEASFKPVNSCKYFSYIRKERLYPTITNIKKYMIKDYWKSHKKEVAEENL